MKKTICIVLSIVMLLSMSYMLTGCKSDAEKIIGSWTADINFADAFNTGISSAEGMEEMGKYFQVSSFILTTTFTFREDGTYTVVHDQDSIKAALESIKGDLRSGIENYFEDMIEKAGLGMSVSELLAASGQTMDSVMEAMFNGEVMDELISEVANEYTGNYRVGDGKIYMTEDTAEEISEEYYDTYELDKDSLTLLECHCKQEEGYEDVSQSIYPVVLTRTE